MQVRKGFTPLELLVVIAIIAVLIALIVPAVQRVRDAARRGSCANNLRQIGLALQGYHDSNGVLPYGMTRLQRKMPYLAWSARILPHLDQAPLWQVTEQAFAVTTKFNENPPHTGLTTSLIVFLCPTEDHLFGSGRPEIPKAAVTNYFGISSGAKANDGVLFPDSMIRMADVSDGSSSTLMVGERGMGVDGTGEYRFGWWYAGAGQEFDGSADYLLGVRERCTTYRAPTCSPAPNHFGPGRADNPCDLFHFWSRHLDGSHFLFVDGSVHYLSYSSDHLLPLLATRNGRETVELPD